MTNITQFRGSYQFLSNMSRVPNGVRHKGIAYLTVENFFQAMKTHNIEDRKLISLMSPVEAKKYGRKVELRTDWFSVRDQVMRYGIKAKFSQEPFKSLLLETEDATLTEGNYWNDSYWGYDLKAEHGQNKLGLILMDYRNILGE